MILSGDGFRFRRLPGRATADPLEGAAPDGFAMRIARLDGNERRSPHRHPFSQEAIFVVSGAGTLWEDGEARRFVQGDSALIEPGVAHATVPDPDTTMELVCFFPHPDLPANTEEVPDIVVNEGRPAG